MKTGRIINGSVVTPGYRFDGASVIIEEDSILEVLPAGSPVPQTTWTYDAAGKYVVPGFFDIHAHGAVGFEKTGERFGVALVHLAAVCLDKNLHRKNF